MEFHRLSTQPIMCIFSLTKNFLRYAAILRQQLLHKTSTHLLQVICFVVFFDEMLKLEISQLNCFPYIGGKVKRSYGVTRFGVRLKRNISEWSTTVCTLARIRRMDRQMLYMIFRNWRSPSNWHQAHDGMLYDKYWGVRSLKKNTFLLVDITTVTTFHS